MKALSKTKTPAKEQKKRRKITKMREKMALLCLKPGLRDGQILKPEGRSNCRARPRCGEGISCIRS